MKIPKDDYKELTTKKIQNPTVGDRFHEMYSSWMYVIGIEEVKGIGKVIYTAHFCPPCKVRAEDARGVYRHTQEGFEKHYFYGTGDLKTTSYMRYADNKPSHVKGILENYRKSGKPIEDRGIKKPKQKSREIQSLLRKWMNHEKR